MIIVVLFRDLESKDIALLLALLVNFLKLMLCVSAIITMITLITTQCVTWTRGLAINSSGMCLWDFAHGWKIVVVIMFWTGMVGWTVSPKLHKRWKGSEVCIYSSTTLVPQRTKWYKWGSLGKLVNHWSTTQIFLCWWFWLLSHI